MTRPYISKPLRELVRQRAGRRCEYCLSAEWLMGVYCEIDHVLPWTLGGTTTTDNLCLACPSCNANKHAKIEGVDPQSGRIAPLFNPRTQTWKDHFAWSDDGTLVIGSSEVGRATVDTLQLNHPLVVSARSIWARAGYSPSISQK